ncbi:Uma2 family endonuclease [Terriglobus sp.]|uniref:Uma2 family endonuclease n=1 Tax=Terriglobus sp. TaxID=1889013 RepID=UPI003AFFA4D1
MPAFVIELQSPPNNLNEARCKMRLWFSNRVELGWLILPGENAVRVYRQGRDPEQHQQESRVESRESRTRGRLRVRARRGANLL